MPESGVSSAQIVFWFLAGLSILTGLGVVMFRNPVRSVIFLVMNFFAVAFLYFGMGAHLIGITQIAVYIGAIMVLFLFVVMLLNLVGPEKQDPRYGTKLFLGGIVATALFVLLFSQVIWPTRLAHPATIDENFGTPQAIGKVLFTQYAWPFEIASVLLLVGVVGAILLAKRRF
jgi:NADH-quinone oxidoreductase subunit J